MTLVHLARQRRETAVKAVRARKDSIFAEAFSRNRAR